MELPIIELTLDNLLEDGLDAVALVENPAIQRNFFAFKEDEAKVYKFQTIDEDKRILAGALMVADFPMYRNQDGKQFYVQFSKQTIEQIVDKVVKENKLMSFNLEHDEKKPIKDIYIQQHYLVDKANGVNAPNYYPELSDGSWFGFIKVNNEQIWNDYVKTGLIKGFSIEGMFSQKKLKQNKQLIKMSTENQKQALSLLAKLKSYFMEDKEEETKMAEMVLADGTIVMGELKEGELVTDAEGIAVIEGEYTLEDGTIFVVDASGKITSIVMPEIVEAKGEVVKEIEVEKEIKKEEEMSAEVLSQITELKSENERLSSEIASLKQEFSSQIESLKENQKGLLDAVELSIVKDTKEKQAFSNVKLDTKVSSLAERFKYAKEQVKN